MRALQLQQIVASLAIATLAACGGGGGGDPAPNPSPSPSGQLDTSYGVTGKVSVTPHAQSTVVGPDGSIYRLGFSVAKLDPTGTPVQNFGDPSNPALPRYSAVLDADGSIYFIMGNERERRLAKVDAGGRPVVLSSSPTFPVVSVPAMALSRDGKLYVAYEVGEAGQARIHVARFHRDGLADLSFGAQGVRFVDVGGRQAWPTSIVLDAAENVIVAGGIQIEGSPAPTFVIAKLDTTGNPMPGFGTNGYRVGPACASSGEGPVIAADAVGGFIMAVSCRTVSQAMLQLLKVDAAGNIVPSFRDGGARQGIFGSASATLDELVIGADGSIYVGGERFLEGQCPDVAVAKLDANGEAVATFGNGGFMAFDQGYDQLEGFGLDAAARLYVAGVGAVPCTPGPRPLPGTSSATIYRLFP